MDQFVWGLDVCEWQLIHYVCLQDEIDYGMFKAKRISSIEIIDVLMVEIRDRSFKISNIQFKWLQNFLILMIH